MAKKAFIYNQAGLSLKFIPEQKDNQTIWEVFFLLNGSIEWRKCLMFSDSTKKGYSRQTMLDYVLPLFDCFNLG